jgi:hypothetical protein
MRALFLFSIAIITLASCSAPGDRSANLPKAAGGTGDIYVFMDSAQWKGPVGKVMDSIFNQEMIGLPREEGIFRMTYVDPRKMNFVLKQRRNLIFLVTLDQTGPGAQIVKNLFTQEQITEIETNKDKYIETYTDVYAKGQQVIFLFGQTQEQLIAKLEANGQKMIDYFNKAESDRLNASLFGAGTITGVSTWLKENFHANMTIPFGYKLVQHEPDFIWVRQMNTDDDRNIFIAMTDYTSLDQFKSDNLVKFRNEVAKKYLYEDPEHINSYLVTETEIPYKPVTTKEVNFGGNYAVEVRGLWRTNTHTMGGPFLAYAMSDQSTGKFFYVEGFVYSPSKDQRELMRQIETVLRTFRLESNSTAASK